MSNTPIYGTIPFFTDLLKQGSDIITNIKRSGCLDAQVKGQFKSGDLDYVTRADLAVRDFYHQKMKDHFPHWATILEDGEEKLTPEELKKDVVVFFDPVDGTKLLQENLPGSSTMAAVAIRTDAGYAPILGLIQIVDGALMYGFDNGFDFASHSNIPRRPIQKNSSFKLGRPKIDRSGLLAKACEILEYQVEFVRGIGPQTEALLTGKTGLFIYDAPGPSFWDAYPAIPIIKSHGGSVCNWRGEEPAYDGSTSTYGGMLATNASVNKDQILVKLSQIYH